MDRRSIRAVSADRKLQSTSKTVIWSKTNATVACDIERHRVVKADVGLRWGEGIILIYRDWLVCHCLSPFYSTEITWDRKSESATPLGQRNVLRALHATGKKIGLHSFRRFRTETLRRVRVPEDLTTMWLGHSKKTVTDFYASGLQEDMAWRRKWCKKVGLGFSLFGLLGLQNVVAIDSVRVA